MHTAVCRATPPSQRCVEIHRPRTVEFISTDSGTYVDYSTYVISTLSQKLSRYKKIPTCCRRHCRYPAIFANHSAQPNAYFKRLAVGKPAALDIRHRMVLVAREAVPAGSEIRVHMAI
jgi:hypothetical protein